MVSTKTILAGILLATSSSLARVTDIIFPTQITAGQNFTALVENRAYIQNWNDFGIIWGLERPDLACQACAGTLIGYETLYDNANFTLGNNTLTVSVPEYTVNGEYILKAAVPYLVAASGGTGIRYFNQTVTVVGGQSSS